MNRLSKKTFWGAMILIALVADSISNARPPGNNRVAKVKNDLRAIVETLELYRLGHGEYPSATHGLRALVEKPVVVPELIYWEKLLDNIPKDSWQRSYLYLNPGMVDPVEVYSFGRDGKLGGCGDDADLYSSSFESVGSKSLKCKSHRLLDGIANWISKNRFLFVVTLIIIGVLINRAAQKAAKPAYSILYRIIGWTITGFGGYFLLLLLFGTKYYH